MASLLLHRTLAVGLAAGSVWWFAAGRREHQVSAARAHWPTTRGFLKSSRVGWETTGRPRYRHTVYLARMEYEYRVGAEDYIGSQLSIERPRENEREAMQMRLARFRAGDSVTVYYDPAKPAVAELEVQPDEWGRDSMMAAPFGVLFAIAWWLGGPAFASQTRRQRERQRSFSPVGGRTDKR